MKKNYDIFSLFQEIENSHCFLKSHFLNLMSPNNKYNYKTEHLLQT